MMTHTGLLRKLFSGLIFFAATQLVAQTVSFNFRLHDAYGHQAKPAFFQGGERLVNEPVEILVDSLCRWQLSQNDVSVFRVYKGGRFSVLVPDGYVITGMNFHRDFMVFNLHPDQGSLRSLDENGINWGWTGRAQAVAFEDVGNPYTGTDLITVTYERTASTQIVIGEAGYATLFYGKPLQLPEGMKAGVVLADDNTLYIDMRYKAGDVVPAATAVVLSGAAGTYELAEAEQTGEAPADNLLRGTSETTQIEGEGRFYKLVNDPVKGLVFAYGAEGGKPFVNQAHKAYLQLAE